MSRLLIWCHVSCVILAHPPSRYTELFKWLQMSELLSMSQSFLMNILLDYDTTNFSCVCNSATHPRKRWSSFIDVNYKHFKFLNHRFTDGQNKNFELCFQGINAFWTAVICIRQTGHLLSVWTILKVTRGLKHESSQITELLLHLLMHSWHTQTWPQGWSTTSRGLSRHTTHRVPDLSAWSARARLNSLRSSALSSVAFRAEFQEKMTRKAETSIIINSSSLLKTPWDMREVMIGVLFIQFISPGLDDEAVLLTVLAAVCVTLLLSPMVLFPWY